MVVGIPGAEMISERELWACAHSVISQHGAEAPAFVAERIGALVLAGDSMGMETWKAIARRIDQLTCREGRPIQ